MKMEKDHNHIQDQTGEGGRSHGHPHGYDHAPGHSHGHPHDHDHAPGNSHAHGHAHSHEHTKAVLNRLAKASGHLQSVSKMIENGRDCSEVLIQLSAVISALKSTGRLILTDHIDHCIIDAVKEGDQKSIDSLKDAIDKFMK